MSYSPKTILSTKILKKELQKRLKNNGFQVTMYDAIDIEWVNAYLPKKIKNALFTSSRAVESVCRSKVQIENCYCVGEKTKALLVKHNQKVLKTAKNASDLASFIVKIANTEEFVYFCGNLNRPDLPAILTRNKVVFSEIEVYKTHLKPKPFSNQFHGVLFFSPSGVKSFVSSNSLKNSLAFCIGETTAKEAKKYTRQVVVSPQQSVEAVVTTALRYFSTVKTTSTL